VRAQLAEICDDSEVSFERGVSTVWLEWLSVLGLNPVELGF